MKSCRKVPLTVDISRNVGRSDGPIEGGVVGAPETVGRELGAVDEVGFIDTVVFIVGALVGGRVKICGAGIGFVVVGARLGNLGIVGAATGDKVILVAFCAVQIEKREKSQTIHPLLMTEHVQSPNPRILPLGRFMAFLNANRKLSLPGRS
jgi:hypothetical protein